MKDTGGIKGIKMHNYYNGKHLYRKIRSINKFETICISDKSVINEYKSQ